MTVKKNSKQNIRVTMVVYPESSKIDHLKNIDVSVDKKLGKKLLMIRA